MVKCEICGKENAIVTEIGVFCERHFIQSIERKFRKNIRKYELIPKYSCVYVKGFEEKDPVSLFIYENLLKLQKRYPFFIYGKDKKEYNIIADNKCMEDFFIILFDYFFFNNNKFDDVWIKKDNIIRITYDFSINDIKLYLDLKGIKYNERKYDEKYRDIINFVNYVTKDKRTMKYALLSSIFRFKEVLNL